MKVESATGQRPQGGFQLAVMLTLLVAMGPVSTDLYLPSLPSIARDLQASESAVQLSIGLFIGGFALMQLICGPLADRFGRKPVLLAGLAIYIAATLACALAESITTLLVGRFEQAVARAEALSTPELLDPTADLVARHVSVKRFGLALLSVLAFEGSGAVANLMAALDVIRRVYEARKRKLPPDAPLRFVPRRWRPHIVTKEVYRYTEVRHRIEA